MLWAIKTKNSQLANFDHDQLSRVVVQKQSPKTSSESTSTSKKIIHKKSIQQLLRQILNYQPVSKYVDFNRIKNATSVLTKKYFQCVYFGQIHQGKKNGTGIMLYTNGRFYEGQWKDNFKQGKGYERFANQSIYQGAYAKGKPQGYGKYQWENGEVYEGQWLQGLKNGSGIWRGSKGDSYIGEWRNGKAHGYGVHTWINGNRYEGQFNQCLKHGQGVQKFSNGDSYKGNYENGKPHGYGQYYWINGSFYKGQFRQGLRNGKGFWKKQNKQNADSYDGQYVDEKKQGYGIFKWSNGSKYIGNFVNDVRQGYGEMYWTDGNVYKGQWQKGEQVEQISEPINFNLDNQYLSQQLQNGSFLLNQPKQDQLQFPNPQQYPQFHLQFQQPNHPEVVEIKRFRARGMGAKIKNNKNQNSPIRIGNGMMVCNNFVTQAVYPNNQGRNPVKMSKRPSRLSFNGTTFSGNFNSSNSKIKHSKSTSQKKAMSVSFQNYGKYQNRSSKQIPIRNFEGVQLRQDTCQFRQGTSQWRPQTSQLKQQPYQMRQQTSHNQSSNSCRGKVKVQPRVIKSSNGVRNIYPRTNKDLDCFWDQVRISRNAILGNEQNEDEAKWFTRSKNKSQYF